LFSSLQLLFLLLVAPLASPVQDIDFAKDILPIFRQHCFECHGDGKAEGELSLDSLSSMLQGGHSGSPLIAPATDSELYLRITSLSEGYRMPKDGDPLTQQEISRIGRWLGLVATRDEDLLKKPQTFNDLNAASSSPSNSIVPTISQDTTGDRSAPAANSVPRNRARSDFGDLLREMQPGQIAGFLFGSAFLLALLGWLIYKSTIGKPRRRKISRDADRVIAFISMLIGALTLLMIIALAYLYWLTTQLTKENEALRSRLQQANAYQSAPLIEIDKSNLPLPPHPMHPPRLGGQYYRGNDERSDSLFNGGFYRTATIDLRLVDSTGRRLQWNDATSDNLEIEIQIRRAPKATRELFTSRVRERVSIEHYCQSTDFNDKLKFTAVKEEELWKARIPLPRRDKWTGDQAQGMVYLMFGTQPGEDQFPRPHFAIRYDLLVRDGKISDESVLWMGSMYTLGNRVLVPDEKKILLDRWFDWRPIPVIEGEAASDPKLLGVEEHNGN